MSFKDRPSGRTPWSLIWIQAHAGRRRDKSSGGEEAAAVLQLSTNAKAEGWRREEIEAVLQSKGQDSKASLRRGVRSEEHLRQHPRAYAALYSFQSLMAPHCRRMWHNTASLVKSWHSVRSCLNTQSCSAWCGGFHLCISHGKQSKLKPNLSHR